MGNHRKKVGQVSAREAYLKKNYGITEKEYKHLLAYGEGACWICKTKPKKSTLNVDHDHKLEKEAGVRLSVRGLLCFMCNKKLIGRRRKEHADMFLAAYTYLKGDAAQRILKGTHETETSEDTSGC